MKKFSKKFLKEVLDLNEEEIKLTMECQRKFPTILLNDGEGCCVDSRKIAQELGVKKQFSHWIKQQIEDLGLEIEKEFKPLKAKTSNTKGGRPSTEYYVTIEVAKEIAMVSGAKGSKTSKKLKENSKMCRKYFILIEKSIRGIQEHKKVRKPERQTYNEMKRVILEDYSKKHKIVTKTDESYLMVRESNMINQNLIGFTATQIKTRLGYTDRETREHLTIEKNKIITKIQEMIIGFVEIGIDFDTRNEMIKKLCDNKYSYIKEEFLNKTK